MNSKQMQYSTAAEAARHIHHYMYFIPATSSPLGRAGEAAPDTCPDYSIIAGPTKLYKDDGLRLKRGARETRASTEQYKSNVAILHEVNKVGIRL